MARTSVTTLNPLTKKLWEEKLLREVPVEQFFAKFTDKSGSNVVYDKSDRFSDRGDVLTFGFKARNPPPFIVNGRLEGNEASLSTYSDTLTLESWKLGYADDGEMSRKRASYDVVEEMLAATKDAAIEGVEDKQFAAMFAAGHSNIVYGGDATSVATLETADKLTAPLVAKLYTIAKTGSHRTFVPLIPIKFEGGTWYILLTHEDNVYDLALDSTMQQANREARERSIKNPLFTEAHLIYRNILIYGHEKCPIFTTGGAGANVPYTTSMLLGAGALMYGEGMAGELVEQRKDYGDMIGIGYHMIAAVKRPTFNSQVYGSIEVITSRTNVSL